MQPIINIHIHDLFRITVGDVSINTCCGEDEDCYPNVVSGKGVSRDFEHVLQEHVLDQDSEKVLDQVLDNDNAEASESKNEEPTKGQKVCDFLKNAVKLSSTKLQHDCDEIYNKLDSMDGDLKTSVGTFVSSLIKLVDKYQNHSESAFESFGETNEDVIEKIIAENTKPECNEFYCTIDPQEDNNKEIVGGIIDGIFDEVKKIHTEKGGSEAEFDKYGVAKFIKEFATAFITDEKCNGILQKYGLADKVEEASNIVLDEGSVDINGILKNFGLGDIDSEKIVEVFNGDTGTSLNDLVSSFLNGFSIVGNETPSEPSVTIETVDPQL